MLGAAAFDLAEALTLMCSCCRRLGPPSSCAGPITRRQTLRALAGLSALPLLAGCDRLPIQLVSDETVEQLGRETWERLRTEMPPSRDLSAQRRVAQIAERLLVTAGEDPRAWEVQVFADPGVNAFVLPGRKIGVLDGMVRVAGGESELAAVIGHEIGHLQAEHSEERLTAEVIRQWGLRLISFLLQINEVAFAQEIAALLGVGVEFGVLRPYSRGQELEADRLGLLLMARAGYEPRAAADLWRRMDRLEQGRMPALLSTHPAPRARIEAIEALIPELETARPKAAIP